MVYRVGIDIIENERVERLYSDSFLRHVLSPTELEELKVCNSKRDYVAGRFVAKEAILKCLIDKTITDITAISITSGAFGEPIVDFGDYDIQVSISHEIKYTVAVAILQDKSDN